MRYEWKRASRVYELHDTRGLKTVQGGWVSRYQLGRLRKIKNKHSCKKFALERYENHRWTYITLLVMKLDEAKQVAMTVLCAGGHDE